MARSVQGAGVAAVMNRFVKVLVAAATICGWSWSASARNDTIMKVAETPFLWAGLYFGVQAGGAWGNYQYCELGTCTETFQFRQPSFDFTAYLAWHNSDA